MTKKELLNELRLAQMEIDKLTDCIAVMQSDIDEALRINQKIHSDVDRCSPAIDYAVDIRHVLKIARSRFLTFMGIPF